MRLLNKYFPLSECNNALRRSRARIATPRRSRRGAENREEHPRAAGFIIYVNRSIAVFMENPISCPDNSPFVPGHASRRKILNLAFISNPAGNYRAGEGPERRVTGASLA